MQYSLAVFDMAGTTVADPGHVGQAFINAMAAAGHPVDAETVRPLMGYRKPEAIGRLLGAAATPALIERIHADFVQSMLHRYRHGPGIVALPAAEAVFAHLRAHGVAVALNTGFSRDIAESIVQRLGWQSRIDAFIASDEVPAGRPAAHMIQTLMARLQITDASAVVKIGDTEVDIQEGRNARVGLVVAVTTGAYTRTQLRSHAPDRVISHLDALPGLLDLPPLPEVQSAAPEASR
ncbi:HAD family hydrolase [Stenotrophomonas rhizophila]|uniref:HAD family hydrolase n=1 Tax=Stenotrophomonas rhizophila TaxID=216778 RepID=UPI001E52887E|nr:HAD family hydrolase [Stenotrophomonas rhizophila]MCC7633539.1 HAD hydrolase-like protein [Stenotrophomonas rhizophila]MCC7662976.1 HAD hydrolase-like protein [Stenotrophomonas rhizophila]